MPGPGRRCRCVCTACDSRWQRLAAISEDLAAHERAAGVSEHRGPDPTFAAIAYAWVAGEGFAEVVDAEELTGGDFVRTTRQLIDVLRQLAIVAPLKSTRRAASEAAEAAFRGVVSDSATTSSGAGPGGSADIPDIPDATGSPTDSGR